MRKLLFLVAFVCVLASLCSRAAVPVTISPVAKQQFPGVDGVPLAGGLLYTYSAGTSSPLATYADSTGNSQNQNPIILDSGGWTPSGLFLALNSYKFVLKNSAGVTQWTIDGVNAFNFLALNVTVAGNWTFSGTTTFSGATIFTGSVSAKTFEGVKYADQFAGADSTAKIDAAFAACGAYTGAAGNSCIVIASPGMACGEPSQATDNVLFIDYRACAQSQGLRCNLSAATAGGVRSKCLLQDNFNASTVGLGASNASATFYVPSYADSPEATNSTIAAINGTQNINSQAGNFTGTLVGIEATATATVTNSVPRTVADMRGLLGNTLIGGNNNITRAVSVYAQGPSGSTSGAIANAYSLYVENPTTTVTTEKLAALFQGPVRLASRVAIGASNSAFIGLLVSTPTDVTGTTQIGMQSALSTSSGATSEGAGIYARADTAASAYTQILNDSLRIQVPVVGAGSTITEWDGIRIDSGSPAGTNYALRSLNTNLSKLDGPISSTAYQTASNCQSAAAPAVCGSAAAGMVVIAAAATSVTVNTTAVGNNSEIFITRDNSLSTALSVTCNTQSSLTLGSGYVSARSTGTSFTITLDVAPTANPACFSYYIVN